MGLLTFSINVTLDGCVDHQEGVADDETHAFFTRLMDESGAMLWGRVTYEMMESYWPAVARGDAEAPPALREWAIKLEAKPKYSTRKLICSVLQTQPGPGMLLMIRTIQGYHAPETVYLEPFATRGYVAALQTEQ